MQIIKVNEDEEGRRLDKHLLKYFDAAPASFVYKNLRKKNIKLCMKKASGSEILKAGDEIELYFSDETLISLSSFAARLLTANDEKEKPDKLCNSSIKEKSIRLRQNRDINRYCSIVYEDDNLIIADKKAGVLSQKAKPEDISLNEILLEYAGKERTDTDRSFGYKGSVSTFTPSICNRLDRNTTGLIIFAKTYAASRSLNHMLKERSMKKYYLTAVEGLVEEKKHIKAWLIKDKKNNKVNIFDKEMEGASLIETAYEPVKFDVLAGKKITYLKVELITGKTHQIRAHLASVGHPILGDIKYGNREFAELIKKKYGIKSHILHSWRLVMPENIEGILSYLSGKTFTANPAKEVQILCVKI